MPYRRHHRRKRPAAPAMSQVCDTGDAPDYARLLAGAACPRQGGDAVVLVPPPHLPRRAHARAVDRNRQAKQLKAGQVAEQKGNGAHAVKRAHIAGK